MAGDDAEPEDTSIGPRSARPKKSSKALIAGYCFVCHATEDNRFTPKNPGPNEKQRCNACHQRFKSKGVDKVLPPAEQQLMVNGQNIFPAMKPLYLAATITNTADIVITVHPQTGFIFIDLPTATRGQKAQGRSIEWVNKNQELPLYLEGYVWCRDCMAESGIVNLRQRPLVQTNQMSLSNRAPCVHHQARSKGGNDRTAAKKKANARQTPEVEGSPEAGPSNSKKQKIEDSSATQSPVMLPPSIPLTPILNARQKYVASNLDKYFTSCIASGIVISHDSIAAEAARLYGEFSGET